MSVARATMSFKQVLNEVERIDTHDRYILDMYLDITRVMFESLPRHKKYQDLYDHVVGLSARLLILRLELLD
jgi:hypothetical protein